MAPSNFNASPVHSASLVDPALHPPALLQMLEVSISRALIEYIISNVVRTVDFALRREGSARSNPVSRNSSNPTFLAFATDVIDRADVTVPGLLAALVYMDHAGPHLQISLDQWAEERVFLGSLVLANKYLNDKPLKNVHWAACTGVFSKGDIGRIEREFLDVLDYDLSITEADLLVHHSNICEIVQHTRRIRTRVRTPLPPHLDSPARHSGSGFSDSEDSDSGSSAASSPLYTPPHAHAPHVSQPFKLAAPPHTKSQRHHAVSHASHAMSAAQQLLMPIPAYPRRLPRFAAQAA